MITSNASGTGAALILAGAMSALALTPAAAERIENQVAVFSALDKVTATIKKLEVPLGQTVEFGALKVTPRVCYSRPATEQPKTTSFVEVDETMLDGSVKRLFTGWMFAESPALNAVEHPVFDVWLTECAKPKNAVAQKAPAAGTPPTAAAAATGGPADAGADTASDAAPPDATAGDTPRRRVRR